MFKLKIETGGAAFKSEDSEDDTLQESSEICRILDRITGEIECGHKAGVVLDLNGNKVGSWSR